MYYNISVRLGVRLIFYANAFVWKISNLPNVTKTNINCIQSSGFTVKGRDRGRKKVTIRWHISNVSLTRFSLGINRKPYVFFFFFGMILKDFVKKLITIWNGEHVLSLKKVKRYTALHRQDNNITEITYLS